MIVKNKCDRKFDVYDAIVVGSGAAGYNAAIRLCEGFCSDSRGASDAISNRDMSHCNMSQKRVALVTEYTKCGTSRNTGSDKQTYYKLGLGGTSPDSVRQMASDLFAGGCVDGDNALCEAALSAHCFYNLCELGVEFPQNRYGEYVGYKTDHDPFARATSAGPLTSRFMTEALERKAATLPIEVLDRLLVVEILTQDVEDKASVTRYKKRVCGLLCLNTQTGELITLVSANIILATGGPAGIYADSVYPECQTGSTGLAIEAGAALQNLTEWQYGLASVKPRWNVSGTYMQVLPRFVSVDDNGVEYEFLSDFFATPYDALSNVFMKGYQWPFDSKKVLEGSSVIDLLVYEECVRKGRHVYLDYMHNPFGMDTLDYTALSPEAYEYLQHADACFGTPFERLKKMNAPAIALYRSKGVDLQKEYLEIALCAQHHNGGIAVDLWWQTTVKGLFAVGECAGTHGITRPGGSALNAGQVGSLRAARYILAHPGYVDMDLFVPISEQALAHHARFCSRVAENQDNVEEHTRTAMRRMSDLGGVIRARKNMRVCLDMVTADLENFASVVGVKGASTLYKAYKLRDILTVQQAVLTAMLDYADTIGKTRGSALMYDKNGILRSGLDETFRLCVAICPAADRIQQVTKTAVGYQLTWRKVRPIPVENDFFENIWKRYREDGNIY